eukprot:m.683295 g.683295  ORF g.683295 m.683295 type:complete len:138 (-) comp22828_c1_seq5:5122-5535(-)
MANAVTTDDGWLDMMDGFSVFDEDDDDGDSAPATGISQSLADANRPQTSDANEKKSLEQPPPDRQHNHNIVGLKNLGASRYRNALLQSLYFSPGFKKRLFHLSPLWLVVPAGTTDFTAPTVRRIPVELQRLVGDMAM